LNKELYAIHSGCLTIHNLLANADSHHISQWFRTCPSRQSPKGGPRLRSQEPS
jgi:hypothetical protein